MHAQPLSNSSQRPRTRRLNRRRWRDNIAGYLFIGPNLIWFFVFFAYPLVWSFVLSLQNWQAFGPSPWVGLSNYVQLLSDAVFGTAYKNAAIYALLTIPAGLIWGVATAVALGRVMRSRRIFRTLFFLPSITSTVAVAVIWKWLFNQDYGLLNASLHLLGIQGPNWLNDPTWALPAVSLTVVWSNTGYWMIIFLAGILDIPQEYYEAARVDGATGWQSLWRITIPLLTPSIFYYLIIALITVWQQFDLVYVMTQGGPANATTMPAFQLYTTAFQNLQVSYASAMAWVIGLIAFALAGVNFLVGRRWVSYAR